MKNDERTELQRAARNVWNALGDVEAYCGDLDKIPGGSAIARKVLMELERASEWCATIMHPDDGGDE